MFVFAVAGRGFQPKTCTTTVALTTAATMWCPSPSVSTERTMYTNLLTATHTPTPDCSTTWPAWSAGTCPTCRGSNLDSVWWVRKWKVSRWRWRQKCGSAYGWSRDVEQSWRLGAERLESVVGVCVCVCVCVRVHMCTQGKETQIGNLGVPAGHNFSLSCYY